MTVAELKGWALAAWRDIYLAACGCSYTGCTQADKEEEEEQKERRLVRARSHIISC